MNGILNAFFCQRDKWAIGPWHTAISKTFPWLAGAKLEMKNDKGTIYLLRELLNDFCKSITLYFLIDSPPWDTFHKGLQAFLFCPGEAASSSHPVLPCYFYCWS